MLIIVFCLSNENALISIELSYNDGNIREKGG